MDGDLFFGEQVAVAEAELEGVAEIDGYGAGDIGAGVGGAGGGYGGAGGQGPGGAGEVYGGGMDINAGDGGAQSVQGGAGGQAGIPRRCEVVGHGGGDEGAAAAGGVEDALAERVGNGFPHYGLGEPVGGVVLAEGAAFLRGDDGFVEDGGDVGGRAGAVFARPVEAGQAAGEGLEEGSAAVHLAGPGEEVGGDDAA